MSVRTPSRLLAALAVHSRIRPSFVALAEIDEAGAVARTCTYATLQAEVSRLATLLIRSAQAGDAIIAIMPAGIAAATCCLAAIAAGVRWVGLDARAAPREVLAIAQRAHATLAIVQDAPAARQAFAGVLPILELDSAPGRPPDVQVRQAPVPGAVVLATSGTTARPKLALRESPALDADADTVVGGLSLTAADCVLLSTPLSHSYGIDMLVASITAGSALHILPRFEIAALLRQLSECVTVLPGVPFIFEALARAAPGGSSRLRLAVSAGAALPEPIRSAFIAHWRLPVGNLYGASELGTVAIHFPSPALPTPPGYIGQAIGGARFRIVDPSDAKSTLPFGQEGHLAVRAPSMLTGYLDEPTPLIDGFFLTGDLARMDADGWVEITGRLKHLIDLGGHKVNPLEIEAELLSHPEIADCAVVALAASQTRSRLRALIVPRRPDGPLTTEDLRAFLRPRLATGKIPRIFEFVQSLPRSPTGKLLRDKC